MRPLLIQRNYKKMEQIRIEFSVLEHNEDHVTMESNIIPFIRMGMDFEQIINILTFEDNALIDLTKLRDNIAENLLMCDIEDIEFEIVSLDPTGRIVFTYSDMSQTSLIFLRNETGHIQMSGRNRPMFAVVTKDLDQLILYATTINSEDMIRTRLCEYKDDYYLELITLNESTACGPFVFGHDFGDVVKRVPEAADVIIEKDAVNKLKMMTRKKGGKK